MIFKKKYTNILLFISIVVLVLFVNAQVEDSFYETSFDGIWAGTISLKTETGRFNFPVAFNLNIQGDMGMAHALLPNTFTAPPSSF